jgi:hypothetical protein
VTIFLRLLEFPVEEKPGVLLNAVAVLCNSREPNVSLPQLCFERDPEAFRDVPGSPFAYWVSNGIRRTFAQYPPLHYGNREAVFGGSTKDDKRYLRLWCEIGYDDVARSRADTWTERWSLFAKGGTHSPNYADIYLVVNWYQDGAEVKADIAEYRGSRGWGYQWTVALNGHDNYFRPGLTWPRRTNGLSFRVMPRGCIFADKGPAVYVGDDKADELLAHSALLTRGRLDTS